MRRKDGESCASQLQHSKWVVKRISGIAQPCPPFGQSMVVCAGLRYRHGRRNGVILGRWYPAASTPSFGFVFFTCHTGCIMFMSHRYHLVRVLFVCHMSHLLYHNAPLWWGAGGGPWRLIRFPPPFHPLAALPTRVLDARPRGARTVAPHVAAAAGRRLSMAQEPLILTEENVITVLAEVRKFR